MKRIHYVLAGVVAVSLSIIVALVTLLVTTKDEEPARQNMVFIVWANANTELDAKLRDGWRVASVHPAGGEMGKSVVVIER